MEKKQEILKRFAAKVDHAGTKRPSSSVHAGTYPPPGDATCSLTGMLPRIFQLISPESAGEDASGHHETLMSPCTAPLAVIQQGLIDQIFLGRLTRAAGALNHHHPWNHLLAEKKMENKLTGSVQKRDQKTSTFT